MSATATPDGTDPLRPHLVNEAMTRSPQLPLPRKVIRRAIADANPTVIDVRGFKGLIVEIICDQAFSMLQWHENAVGTVSDANTESGGATMTAFAANVMHGPYAANAPVQGVVHEQKGYLIVELAAAGSISIAAV